MIRYASKHTVASMFIVLWLALFAVESVVYLATELNLVVPVLLAEKLLRVEGEIFAIAQPCIVHWIFASRLKLLFETHIV